MTIDEAAALIAGVRRNAREAETWADLGSGNGIFTRALATLLPAGSVIHAMDHDARALKEIPPAFGAASIVTHVGDFTSVRWPFGSVDGLLLANSLHYVRDPLGFIRRCETSLAVPHRFVIVEYDTERANPWVPYPISWKSLTILFERAGYSSIERLGSRPSRFRQSAIYAALIQREPTTPRSPDGSS